MNWRFFTSFLTVLCLLSRSEALKCYICNNCIKFELSQSRTCPVDSTHCMKLDMITNQVQRRCATLEMCQNPEKQLKIKNKQSTCCEGDNCNGGSNLFPMTILLSASSYWTFIMQQMF